MSTYKIPPIIFSTCSGQQASLDSIRSARERLTSNNPSWQYIEFSDADCIEFIRKHFDASIFDCFQAINPVYGAARADLFRYCLIYRSGGVYLDIKSTVLPSLDSIIRPDDSFLLSQWDNRPGQSHYRWGIHPELSFFPGGEYQQWFIAAQPGHPFLKTVIENVIKNIIDYPSKTEKTFGKSGVLRVTGPIAYTLAINNYILSNNLLEGHLFRHINSFGEGFRYSIFEESGETLTHSLTSGSRQKGSAHSIGNDASQYSKTHYINRTDPIVIPFEANLTS